VSLAGAGSVQRGITWAFLIWLAPLLAAAAATSTTTVVPLGTPEFAGIVGDGKTVGFSWWVTVGATGGYELSRASDPQAAPTTIAALGAGTTGAIDAQPASTGMCYQLLAIGANGAPCGLWSSALGLAPMSVDASASGTPALML
jgi:hypothetical protein